MGAPPAAAALPPTTANENGKPAETAGAATAQPKTEKHGKEEDERGQPTAALPVRKTPPGGSRHHAGVAAQTGLRRAHAVEEALVRPFRILSVLL